MDKLKQKFFEKSLELIPEIKSFIRANGSDKIDEVSAKQVFGGMRGIKSMLWETSELDPQEGIRFRGNTIPQLKKLLPKYKGGKEPMPEALFWLMLADEIPTEEEAHELSKDWIERGGLPDHVKNAIEALDINTHPMTQFSIGIMAMQRDSIFAKKYFDGISKSDYWDPIYEDTSNLIAKLPDLAAYIYRRIFKKEDHIERRTDLDWSGNFVHMLGYSDPDFLSYMRLYLTIHADHEGGNASAHTVHLVGSTLSDPYLSFAAGMNSLAGPLHGLANQEVIKWIFRMVEKLGTTTPSDEQVAQYIRDTLASGQVIPGYGHAVLRQPDPRFVAQKVFAEEYIKDSEYVNIVWQLFDLVPEILKGLGKVKNPWPNVDAHSGSILVHYGMREYSFYTVLFGVSRALGVLSAMCWSRALGLPLERPKSLTFERIKQIIYSNKSDS